MQVIIKYWYIRIWDRYTRIAFLWSAVTTFVET